MTDDASGPPGWSVRASSPSAWYWSAPNLKLAADLVWEAAMASMEQMRDSTPRQHEWPRQHHLPRNYVYALPSYRLLAAAAIENLLKGILVGEHPETWINGGKLDWHGPGHELLRLATAGDLLSVIDDVDNELLKRFQDALEWTGRYHVPTRESRRARGLEIGFPPDEWEQFDRLYTRLASILWEIMYQRSWREPSDDPA